MSTTGPLDPARPLVCLDETSRQLLADIREPLPVVPGHPARHDPEYVRGGVVNCFLVTAPLRGWREVQVSAQRTRIDWAHCVRDLVDRPLSGRRADRAGDGPAQHAHPRLALLRPFPPAEAKRIADKLEIHYTPKHGSWLNMAEIELSVLQRQCLGQRFADRATMEAEVARLGGDPECRRGQHRLAVHDGGCPDQAPSPLPCI